MSVNGTRASALGLAAGLGLSVLGGTAGIATAGADANAYTRKLHDAGIDSPRGDYELKEWGYEVCYLRERGKPPRQWVEQTVYSDSLKPQYGLTEQQANMIVDIAVAELCDDRDGPGPYGVS
jgi:hypothetical protein